MDREKSLRVLAVDPGRTTGFCLAIIDMNGEAVLQPWQERTEVNRVWHILDTIGPDIIVMERFDFRKNSREGLDLHPKELIGVARLHSIMNHSEWQEQTPAQGMGYWSDASLKKAKVYLPGKPHAVDATRHFLHWFVFGAGYKYNTTGKEYPFALATAKGKSNV